MSSSPRSPATPPAPAAPPSSHPPDPTASPTSTELSPRPGPSALETLPQYQPPLSADKSDSSKDAASDAGLERTPAALSTTGARLKHTLSRAYNACQAAQGIKDPWGLKWRSHPVFLTGVVTIGIMSDILAYAIIAPILPFRLSDLGSADIAALTSWHLFAYSAGVFVGTFPTAWFFHRYPVRRGPLVAAVLIMIGSCVLFMLPPHFASMFISRFVQGLSSCIMWTVGFALICENIDPSHIGRHLGVAFTGVSLGATIAPPIGGSLYKRMGWYAPFIFMIIVLSLDTIARLFIIEVKDIKRLRARQAAHARALAAEGHTEEAAALERSLSGQPTTEAERQIVGLEEQAEETKKIVELTPWGVLKALLSLPRGIVAFFQFFAYGFVIGAFDSTTAIRVKEVWHKDSEFVGLIFLAGAAPSFIVGPLAGWASDRWGTEFVVGVILFFMLPWIPLLTLTASLPGFIVFFSCMHTAASALNTIAAVEVATVSKFREGISEIHQFAAMNLAFAVASAVGAIAGGQIYNNVPKGWDVTCWVSFSIYAVIIPPSLYFTGAWPLFWRVLRKQGPRSGMHPDDAARMDAELDKRDGEKGETGFGADAPSPRPEGMVHSLDGRAPAAPEVEMEELGAAGLRDRKIAVSDVPALPPLPFGAKSL